MEEYRVIPDYPRYSISNLGNVINNQTGQVISQRKSSRGYMRFNVRTGIPKYEKPKTLVTHRMVAELFLPKVQGKDYINHKDADKTNNCVDNLEWCTPKENSVHACETIQGLKEKYQRNIKKAQEANGIRICVYKGNSLIGKYNSKREVAQALGISEKTVYNDLHGMTSRHGYVFCIDQ